MPKNQYTPREELVCGKLDRLADLLIDEGDTSFFTMMGLIESIRYDCTRMEAKLATRKQEVEYLINLLEDLGYT